MARTRIAHRSVTGGLVAGLAILVAAHLASGIYGTSLAGAVHEQTDFTTGKNLAALYQCIVALAAALLCTRIALRARSGWSRIGWMCIAGGLTLTCVLEFTAASGSSRAIPLMVALASVPFVVFIYKHSLHLPEARFLLAILFALMLSNPVTDGIERHITSDSDNYTFVAINEPYEFAPDAWTRLRIVSHVQEISEILAIVIIVAIVEALLSSPTAEAMHRRKPSATVQPS